MTLHTFTKGVGQQGWIPDSRLEFFFPGKISKAVSKYFFLNNTPLMKYSNNRMK